jgi:hypothetical protein
MFDPGGFLLNSHGNGSRFVGWQGWVRIPAKNHPDQTFCTRVYTGAHIIGHEFFLAGNQVYHQNLVPSMTF